ncbi:MAG: tRNA (5-methylaminomethyl-2-thiouridine)(34)-methyltransferase MnmD [Oceanicaulis sp.]
MTDFTLKRPFAMTDWTEAGPVAVDAGDVYFSNQNGLEESRAVFLAGAGYPGRFRPGLNVVGELGFGTGLNFLALWDAFRAHAPAGARLHFVSVEGYPLRLEDARRALSAFRELSPLADALLAAWPSPHKGAHRRIFDAGRVVLTLVHDEAGAALANMQFRADAWFLDGFAPARNPDMWSDAVFSHVARLSKPGAPAATFTVAGAVRRGLAAAGYAVEKKPGFGRKRERLEAIYEGVDVSPEPTPFALPAKLAGPVAIVGGGIGAASLVHAFALRDIGVDVYAEGGWGAGASGAPLGLLTPRLEAADRPHARALLSAFEYARTLYDGRDGFYPGGVHRLSEDKPERIEKLAQMLDGGFELQPGGTLLMTRAGRFDPARLVASLAGEVSPRDMRVAGLEIGAGGVRIVGENKGVTDAYQTVIVAGGWAGSGLVPGLPLEATAGRVAVFDTPDPPQTPAAWGGYAAPFGGGALVGATHVKGDNPGSDDEAEPHLRALAADGMPDLVLGARTSGWGGVRAATPDRLPVCGALPAGDFAEIWGCAARGGPAPERGSSASPVLVLGGFGARGFAHAPLLAEHLVSTLLGEPFALERAGAEALHPARFAWRALRRS